MHVLARYGSCDGGWHAVNKDTELSAMMAQLGRALNLKEHVAGVHGKAHLCVGVGGTTTVTGHAPPCSRLAPWLNVFTRYGPTDLEAHLGTDGKYYVLDAARLMPPTFPAMRSGVAHSTNSAVFTELFRCVTSCTSRCHSHPCSGVRTHL